jgi:D-alanyl-D-alanine carboxypeptidase
MKWTLTIATLLIILSLPGCRGEDITQTLADRTLQSQSLTATEIPDELSLFPVDIEAALQRRLASEVSRGKTPGVAMYVETSNGIWMGAEGFANKESETSMKPTDRFRIGRTTNLFMAVVGLQLAEEGVLDLNAPIASYLPPEVGDRIVDSDQIRVRQLLNHTSGIPDVYTSGFFDTVQLEPDYPWTTLEVLEFAYDREPTTVKGVFSYSSTNYLLLELILEKVTGLPLAEIIQQRVQEPAGLTNTFLELREPIPGGFAQGYQDWNNDGTSENVTTPLINAGLGLGDRGLVSNATDLVRFFRALLYNDSLLYHYSIEEMLSPTPIGAAEGYGLGLTYQLTPWGEAWGQTSSTLGFQSVILYLPIHDLTMVVWMNQGDPATAEPLSVAEDSLRIILGEPNF